MISKLFLSWALGFTSFNQQALQNIEAVWSGLGQCHLKRALASDPTLLPPTITADEAILNSEGQILAYFRQYQWYGYTRSEWVAPNGGFEHALVFNNQYQEYMQPYQGSVARSYINVSTGGSYPTYFCGQSRVNAKTFQRCTEHYWSSLIVKQLCRFGN